MSDESPHRAAPAPERLGRMEWSDIREPGIYLHIASGLIARVYAEDVAAVGTRAGGLGGGPVVRLVPNPSAPMAVLREIAERHGLRVIS